MALTSVRGYTAAAKVLPSVKQIRITWGRNFMATTSQALAGHATDPITAAKVDVVDLEQRVKSMYKAVAENPHDERHLSNHFNLSTT